VPDADRSFSALQRAENSSIDVPHSLAAVTERVSVLFSEPKIPQYPRGRRADVVRPVFQCSSASRKFLNTVPGLRGGYVVSRFSALQRAENSSICVNTASQRGQR